ncbi:hypothetical protein AB9F29_16780 [Falsihalocynthiibacter sp. S25ZX9]|uniref:hypothetical protein n=1 Tax=Falsihalocynthiibacter sp. S25ZX9 TaxID=3240870 RepID=UPI00350EE114
MNSARQIHLSIGQEAWSIGPQQSPELGAEVRFMKHPSAKWEAGIVRGRQFGTGIIEVIDLNAKQVRLMPEQYEFVRNATCPEALT